MLKRKQLPEQETMSFFEMSPACFRPAFDEIQEAWLDGKQDSGGVHSLGYPSKWADSRMTLPESAISTANAE
jgi:hypothetical protein